MMRIEQAVQKFNISSRQEIQGKPATLTDKIRYGLEVFHTLPTIAAELGNLADQTPLPFQISMNTAEAANLLTNVALIGNSEPTKACQIIETLQSAIASGLLTLPPQSAKGLDNLRADFEGRQPLNLASEVFARKLEFQGGELVPHAASKGLLQTCQEGVAAMFR